MAATITPISKSKLLANAATMARFSICLFACFILKHKFYQGVNTHTASPVVSIMA